MNKNIVCIGAGYIGGPTMAVIAKATIRIENTFFIFVVI